MSGSRDYVIVGAGIIGLATALRIQQREPASRVTVVDKENDVAVHQTGHNSGVLHAGLYYRPGSLKARLCREGKAELERYAAERGIPFDTCGKVVVAVSSDELPRLDDLAARGAANGIQGLRRLAAEELGEFEPHVRGVAGLHVPETGVIDYRAIARSFANDIRTAGGEVLLGREVRSIKRHGKQFVVATALGELEARKVVCCAGLYSDRIPITPASDDGRVRIVPFRGTYYHLSERAASLVRALIYPVPNPSFPFLGVHFTRHIDGQVTAGPSAVLAFAREGYARAHVNPRDLAQTLRYGGFWRLARKYWRTGLAEQWRDMWKPSFVQELRRYVPELESRELTFGPTGVRAQALDRDGSLVDDFVLAGRDGVLRVGNAPSPGATASLAIGRVLAERAHEMG
jgi:L-2-hydroxyglutarate oxidase LhgO